MEPRYEDKTRKTKSDMMPGFGTGEDSQGGKYA